MKIRHATEDDVPRIIAMAARFLLESQYGRLFDDKATPESIRVLVANVMSMGVIFVAEAPLSHSEEDRVELFGMLAAIVIPHPLTGRKYAEEVAWWVEPEYRGGLLGPKMLRSFEEWATRNDANMVKMVAPAGGDVGKFLEAVGYQAVETAFVKFI